ncbi:RNA helicase [Mycoemilia scoparia]|uniref:RNA helicase n=1 Tax=Mycoemilia scoparia TaxID=417184 RepID=A0A9W8A6K4_9FUNG|nr:RNA helicase [Mycoemilia scoparia]
MINEMINEDELDDHLARRIRSMVLKDFGSKAEYQNRCTDIGLSVSTFENYKDQFIQEVNDDAIPELNPGVLIPVILREGLEGVQNRLIPNFLGFLEKASPKDAAPVAMVRALADCRYPHEWNPASRLLQRKVIMHVGPTNSGKTYSAIQKLKKAESGIYCSPLRLLAYEVFVRMNREGIPCRLITGEERREPEVDGKPLELKVGPLGKPHIPLMASTIEMANISTKYDVAVIDEIQVLTDMQRGWAWTQALHGLRAKEIHLCGEPTAVPLVQRLFKVMNEDVEVRTYDRLGSLQVSNVGLGSKWVNIKKGDCVVTFSRNMIFQVKRDIEQSTGMKCAIVYGGLPPETRAEQARLFNDPKSGYDVLVASDAIGMGLNLNINRVVFETLSKFDGKAMRPISISQVRQIGGRAGRYQSAYDKGVVTTLHNKDLHHLDKHINMLPPPLPSAGIKPPTNMIEMFSHQFPNVPFSKLWLMFQDCAQTTTDFHMCQFKDQKVIADSIESIPLSVQDRYQLMYAPIQIRDPDLLKTAVDVRPFKCIARM